MVGPVAAVVTGRGGCGGGSVGRLWLTAARNVLRQAITAKSSQTSEFGGKYIQDTTNPVISYVLQCGKPFRASLKSKENTYETAQTQAFRMY